MFRVFPHGQLLRTAFSAHTFTPVCVATSLNYTIKSALTKRAVYSCTEARRNNVNIQLDKTIYSNNLPSIYIKQNLSQFPTPSTSVFKLPKIYAALSKWYLTLFVGVTMDAGFCLAPVPFDQLTFLLTTAGTLLCSASANTLNQIAEVEYDGLMDRTRSRPLVRKLITPFHASCFAAFAGISGFSLLYLGGNPLTAWLGVSTIILYAAIYTPLKRKHWFNTWVGSVVGAIPPMMGWTAATGSLDAGAFIFSGILFAWQFPHFYALAWRRRNDYVRGSYHMLPISHPNATKHVVVAHSLALWGLCSAAPATGITSLCFVGMTLPLNVWLTYNSVIFQRRSDSRSASKLYKSTLYYIILVSLALVLDRKLLSKYDKEKIKLWFSKQHWVS